MSVIVIDMDMLPAMYQKERGKVNAAMNKGARAAAYKLKAYLVDHVDELGITYMGIYRNSFEVDGNSVINTAPHSGIIELGARPHKVSEEGFRAIKQWVRVKLLGLPAESWSGLRSEAEAREAGDAGLAGLNALFKVKDEAEGITWAIVKKIEREGQEPKYVMRNAIPKATQYFKEEFERILAQDSIGNPKAESWGKLQNEAEIRGEGLGKLNKPK